jgi:hypothetical protein
MLEGNQVDWPKLRRLTLKYGSSLSIISLVISICHLWAFFYSLGYDFSVFVLLPDIASDAASAFTAIVLALCVASLPVLLLYYSMYGSEDWRQTKTPGENKIEVFVGILTVHRQGWPTAVGETLHWILGSSSITFALLLFASMSVGAFGVSVKLTSLYLCFFAGWAAIYYHLMLHWKALAAACAIALLTVLANGFYSARILFQDKYAYEAVLQSGDIIQLRVLKSLSTGVIAVHPDRSNAFYSWSGILRLRRPQRQSINLPKT